MNRFERLLIEQTYPYLETFLIEEKSFYPFAMLMNKEMIAIPIDADIEEEYPTSEYLIDLFESGIKKEIEKKNSFYLLGIICIDVYIDKNKNGVEFRLINLSNEKTVYLAYDIIGNKVIWSKL